MLLMKQILMMMKRKKFKVFILFLLIFSIFAASLYFLGKYFSSKPVIVETVIDRQEDVEIARWNYFFDFETVANKMQYLYHYNMLFL